MRISSISRGLLLLCALLSALLVAACGSSTSQTATPPTATPAPLTSAGTVSATISGLGANPEHDYGIAASDTAIWVRNGATGTLVRIAPTTNTIVATIPVGHGEGGVALGNGAVWVVNSVEGTVSRIDPQTNQVTATITLTSQGSEVVQAIAVSPDAVWVTQFGQNALVRIDPRTNQVVATIAAQPGITGVSFGAGAVWTCNHHDSAEGLAQVNPQTNQIQAQIAVGDKLGMACSSVVALAQTVWTTSFSNEQYPTTLRRIDPAAHKVIATIPIPQAFAAPFHFAANEQGVWLYGDAGVYRVDPATNRPVGLLDTQDSRGIALGAGSVWVCKSDGTLLRITPAS